jgi:hypothetical protein
MKLMAESASLEEYESREEIPSIEEIMKEGIYLNQFKTRGDFKGITHLKVFRQ